MVPIILAIYSAFLSLFICLAKFFRLWHERPPRRKALIIGLDYKANPSWDPIHGQRDAIHFKAYLIHHRGWQEGDIVIMLDVNPQEPLRFPTRRNIMREISILVCGAKSGDRFVFFFSGHSAQLEQPMGVNTELDGKDEFLVTADCGSPVTQGIVDNELRKILVNPLPEGCYLTAIFDACHSGTLLDLDHDRCNSVYTPWVSKGNRRAETKRNRIWRKDAAEWLKFAKHKATFYPQISAPPMAHSATPRHHLAFPFATTRFPLLPLHRETWPPLGPSICQQPRPALTLDAPAMISAFNSLLAFAGIQTPILCESPEATFKCDGFCRNRAEFKNNTGAGLPHVVSLSACNDSQRAWETSDGDSMTAALIRILIAKPSCTLEDLLRDLSYSLYDTSRIVHEHYQQTRRNHLEGQLEGRPRAHDNSEAAPSPVLDDGWFEIDNFQDPQLSSLVPLDMQGRLVL